MRIAICDDAEDEDDEDEVDEDEGRPRMTTGRPESAARIEKDTIGASVAVAAARSANANTFCTLIASAVSTTTGVAAPVNAAACKSKKSDGSQEAGVKK